MTTYDFKHLSIADLKSLIGWAAAHLKDTPAGTTFYTSNDSYSRYELGQIEAYAQAEISKRIGFCEKSD